MGKHTKSTHSLFTSPTIKSNQPIFFLIFSFFQHQQPILYLTKLAQHHNTTRPNPLIFLTINNNIQTCTHSNIIDKQQQKYRSTPMTNISVQNRLRWSNQAKPDPNSYTHVSRDSTTRKDLEASRKQLRCPPSMFNFVILGIESYEFVHTCANSVGFGELFLSPRFSWIESI